MPALTTHESIGLMDSPSRFLSHTPELPLPRLPMRFIPHCLLAYNLLRMKRLLRLSTIVSTSASNRAVIRIK